MLIPVILSGGAGARLWPVSRSTWPKPFMRMQDGESLLYKTLERALQVADGPVLTVTNRDYRFLTRDEYEPYQDIRALPLMLEPGGRNTAPAILLAALHLQRCHGDDAIMLVLPADHLIDDRAAFAANVRRAARLAADDWLVTFGIVPDRAETGFGYIRKGRALAEGAAAVEAFVEKPDANTAAAYLASAEYLWNSGMFCFRVGAVLDAAENACPEVMAAVRECDASASDDDGVHGFDAALFLAQPNISFDYAVMERAAKVAVIPAAFDWNDIGSWQAVSEMDGGAAPDASGNRLRGDAVVIDSARCYIEADARLVAAVGVQDLIIVDTGDAVLVADRAHTQEVKQVVERLRAAKHPAASVHRTARRPWGSYTVLEDADDCKVKRLTVKPGGILSLQRHQRRSEHWTVVDGRAKVRVGDIESVLERNQSTYIPANTLHRLENPGDTDLHLIEVQCGDYFGEDDIERLEDVYGRAPTQTTP